ncbi:MAG: XdhC family protein [bacterium JZ-2024 1]
MRDWLELLEEVEKEGKRYVVAVVVKTEGSTSGKAGAKAVILEDGKVKGGWLGGGCVEAVVIQEAFKVLSTGEPKLIELDLSDEWSGVGMPCGGKMWVYLEPKVEKPWLVIIGGGALARALAEFSRHLGFSVIVDAPGEKQENYPDDVQVISDDTDFTGFPVYPHTYVVVASQHKSDDRALETALRKGAKYIGLIASRKRAGIVLNILRSRGLTEEVLSQVHSPAGLDIGAKTPGEIALSILAEIIYEMRKKTRAPLSKSFLISEEK